VRPDLAAVRPNSTAVWQCGGGAPISGNGLPKFDGALKSGGGPPTFNGGLEMQRRSAHFWKRSAQIQRRSGNEAAVRLNSTAVWSYGGGCIRVQHSCAVPPFDWQTSRRFLAKQCRDEQCRSCLPKFDGAPRSSGGPP